MGNTQRGDTLKISTQTRYAIRLLMELALDRNQNDLPGNRITAKIIAERQGISEKYLEAIAAKLCKAGILNSMKGVGGGYYLQRDPASISLGNVMRLMETTYFETHCRPDAEKCCTMYDGCVLADIWSELEEAISHVVDNITIADVISRHNERVKPVAHLA